MSMQVLMLARENGQIKEQALQELLMRQQQHQLAMQQQQQAMAAGAAAAAAGGLHMMMWTEKPTPKRKRPKNYRDSDSDKFEWQRECQQPIRDLRLNTSSRVMQGIDFFICSHIGWLVKFCVQYALEGSHASDRQDIVLSGKDRTRV